MRSPEPTDAPKILEWFAPLVAEDTFITVLPSQEVTLEDEERFLTNILSRIEANDALHLYAEALSGEIVGHMGVDRGRGRFAHCGHLSALVSEKWRDCGLGTELIRTHLSEIHRLDLHALYLSVMASNPRAIHLYLKVGFRECGRRPDYVRHRGALVDLIDMWLPLDDVRL